MKVESYEGFRFDLEKIKIPRSIKTVVLAMQDKKAEKIVILKLRGLNKITNYMVICSGNSHRQNHAIAHAIQLKLKTDAKQKAFSVEGEKNADWILLDYIDFIVHVFTPECREKYLIEKLWMDAKRYDFYAD